MVPDTQSPSTVDSRQTDRSSSLVVNALIGGIAGMILSFIPFSPVLGGAIAGYLQGGTVENGITAGAVAGFIMLVPFTFLGMFLVFFIGFGGMPRAIGIVGFFLLFFAVFYTVVLGVLGGFIGVYLKNEL